MGKLKLDPDALDVQTFETREAAAWRRGTVRGAAGCTSVDSCPCPSSLFHCGTLHSTLVSCDYTKECDTLADCPTLDCPPNTDFRTCPCQ